VEQLEFRARIAAAPLMAADRSQRLGGVAGLFRGVSGTQNN
jgi:hypothetical protein